jgi:NADH-quinone oxidoreductase subunit G
MAEEIKKEAPKLFKVTIDNITIEVTPGTSILNAARQIGGEVAPPAMCYYTKLQGSGGKCRTCLVEVAAGSTVIQDQCQNWWHLAVQMLWMV